MVICKTRKMTWQLRKIESLKSLDCLKFWFLLTYHLNSVDHFLKCNNNQNELWKHLLLWKSECRGKQRQFPRGSMKCSSSYSSAPVQWKSLPPDLSWESRNAPFWSTSFLRQVWKNGGLNLWTLCSTMLFTHLAENIMCDGANALLHRGQGLSLS